MAAIRTTSSERCWRIQRAVLPADIVETRAGAPAGIGRPAATRSGSWPRKDGRVGMRGARGDKSVSDGGAARTLRRAPARLASAPIQQCDEMVARHGAASIDQGGRIGSTQSRNASGPDWNQDGAEDPASASPRSAASVRGPSRCRRRDARPDCLYIQPFRAHHAPTLRSRQRPRYPKWRLRGTAARGENSIRSNRTGLGSLSAFI